MNWGHIITLQGKIKTMFKGMFYMISSCGTSKMLVDHLMRCQIYVPMDKIGEKCSSGIYISRGIEFRLAHVYNVSWGGKLCAK